MKKELLHFRIIECKKGETHIALTKYFIILYVNVYSKITTKQNESKLK